MTLTLTAKSARTAAFEALESSANTEIVEIFPRTLVSFCCQGHTIAANDCRTGIAVIRTFLQIAQPFGIWYRNMECG